jgi:hypothetical protein
MAQMIYRGFEHDGTRMPIVRFEQNLVYRGVSHKGQSDEPYSDCSAVSLIYRGVAHGAMQSGGNGSDPALQATPKMGVVSS